MGSDDRTKRWDGLDVGAREVMVKFSGQARRVVWVPASSHRRAPRVPHAVNGTTREAGADLRPYVCVQLTAARINSWAFERPSFSLTRAW